MWQQQRAPFSHFTRCADARRRDRRHTKFLVRFWKAEFQKGGLFVTDRIHNGHEQGHHGTENCTRQEAPPRRRTRVQRDTVRPPWQIRRRRRHAGTPQAATNQPTCNHDIHAHTQSLYGVSVRYPSAPLRAHSLSSQTDRRQTDILPVCDPGSCLFCLLDLVIDLVSHRRQYRHVTLHATIGSRPWPALGVALIKRTIVPIFSRRRRAYAEPFRSARPAATGACGRRAPRGHHHTCSGCAVGW